MLVTVRLGFHVGRIQQARRLVTVARDQPYPSSTPHVGSRDLHTPFPIPSIHHHPASNPNHEKSSTLYPKISPHTRIPTSSSAQSVREQIFKPEFCSSEAQKTMNESNNVWESTFVFIER